MLFYRNLRKLKYLLDFHPLRPSFADHARRGALPNYAVIEQHYLDSKLDPANDDHPSHDVYQGQMLVKYVYETLRASPQWNQTLLVITYDEHGGFFDHVPTPVAGVPSPDGIVGPPPYNFTFDRLGVRVPAILVSPWIDRGTVVHGPHGPTPTSQYEHSSIPATVKKIFGLPQDFLTRRDAWAGLGDLVLARHQARPRGNKHCGSSSAATVHQWRSKGRGGGAGRALQTRRACSDPAPRPPPALGCPIETAACVAGLHLSIASHGPD